MRMNAVGVRRGQRLLLAAMSGLVTAILFGALWAYAQDPVPPGESLQQAFPAQKHYSPYAARNFPTHVF